jgi:hypothetical protein
MGSRLRLLLTALSIVGVCVVVFSVPFLYSNDGPQHLLGAYVHRFYERFDEVWYLNEPLTDHGYRELVELLLGFQDPFAAHQTALAIIGALYVLGWSRLGSVLRPGSSGWEVPPIASLFVAKCYFWGLIPFLFSLALAPWMLSWVWRRRLERPLDIVVVGGLLIIMVQIHPFPPALAGLFLVVQAVCERDLRFLARLAAAGFLAGAYALYISKLSIPTSGGSVDFAFDAEPLGFFFGELIPDDTAGQAFLGLLMVSVIGLAIVGGRGALILRLAVAGWIVSLGVPDNVPGWEILSARFAPFFVPVALCAAFQLEPARMASRAKRIGAWAYRSLAPLGVLTALAHGLHARTSSTEIFDDVHPFFTALESALPDFFDADWDLVILRGSLPLVLDDTHGPIGHLAQLVAMTKRGRPNWSQASGGSLHHLARPRVDGTHPAAGRAKLGEYAMLWNLTPPAQREQQLAAYLANLYTALVYVFVADPAERPLLEDLGFLVHQTLPLDATRVAFLTTFEGCTVSMAFESPVADVVELGIAPDEDPYALLPIGAGRTDLLFEHYPCGRWWVRPELGCTADPRSLVDVYGQDTHLVCRNTAPGR